jgi:hypothetical protein
MIIPSARFDPLTAIKAIDAEKARPSLLHIHMNVDVLIYGFFLPTLPPLLCVD